MSMVDPRNLIAAAPALGLFAVSCALPALTFWNTQTQALQTMPGLHALAMGGFGVLAGQYGWLANPLWLGGVVTLLTGQRRVAVVLGGLALLASLHTLALYKHPLPANEAGEGELQLRALGIGAYLWMGSMASLALGAAVRLLGRAPA
jgi:hypothetical protein